MEIDAHKAKTKKAPLKPKPRTKPLPKAKQNFLEAEEALIQELEENLIGFAVDLNSNLQKIGASTFISCS